MANWRVTPLACNCSVLVIGTLIRLDWHLRAIQILAHCMVRAVEFVVSHTNQSNMQYIHLLPRMKARPAWLSPSYDFQIAVRQKCTEMFYSSMHDKLIERHIMLYCSMGRFLGGSGGSKSPYPGNGHSVKGVLLMCISMQNDSQMVGGGSGQPYTK